MPDFWSNIPTNFTNEADVELRLVIPLLNALGYEQADIAAKYPVVFREGRVGRRPEADFVCFNGPLHNRDTSLLVVEAKAIGEALKDGKFQGESYSANLRAPLLLLTNGERLEIWQLQVTQDSQRVFDESVPDLTASRGTIERLLMKASVVDYCRTFHIKDILDASADFGRYEQAELKRTSRYGNSVSRTVHRSILAETNTSLEAGGLLAECPLGCVVIAPSGYGKTTLSKRLFRQAIEERWRGTHRRLAFDIPVTDLEETGLSIAQFMQRRVNAHQPRITEAAMIDQLRAIGATLFFDSFDRASSRFQRRVIAEIRNLLRDYPLAQVFLFSREAARPVVALPLYTLELLTDDEKGELEKLILDDGSANFSSVVGMMSPTLSALCANPLLLQLALDYWKREKSFPRQLAPLFRSWLENVLIIQESDAVSSIFRERALTLIATATTDGPIAGAQVIALLVKREIPVSTLNELVTCDAARLSGSAIEVQHEALADYLRAKEIASGSESDLLTQIQGMLLPAGSFFPVLLMAQLPTHGLQAALWERITEAGPAVYFDALRYRFDVSSELSQLEPAALSERYLTELLDGIERPLNSFFPALREAIVQELTTEPGRELAVVGQVHVPSSSLSYKFVVRPLGSYKAVIVDRPMPPGILRGVSLDASNYRLDSARLVGIDLLKDGVLEAVKFKTLKGGAVWAEERLIGCCRFLSHEYDIPLTLDMSLEVIETVLLPHKDKRVYPGPLSHQERFSIQSLLDDIAVLRASGKAALDLWWYRLGWSDSADHQSNHVIRGVLDEQYRRAQIVYAEIVQATFPAIAGEMTFFPAFPVRWNLNVVRRKPVAEGATIYFSWQPVATWREAGADVSFDDKSPGFEDIEVTRANLAALGRPNVRLFGCNGFTQLSDFSGRQWTCYFDGATPATHDVCSFLKEDLDYVFSSMPRQESY